MTFVASLLGVVLMFAEGGTKISFGIYDIAKSLTIPGWIVIIIAPHSVGLHDRCWHRTLADLQQSQDSSRVSMLRKLHRL